MTLKLALIGYGKMGKAIEEIAVQRGHTIQVKIDYDNLDDFTQENFSGIDAAIEFTNPESAPGNVKKMPGVECPGYLRIYWLDGKTR